MTLKELMAKVPMPKMTLAVLVALVAVGFAAGVLSVTKLNFPRRMAQVEESILVLRAEQGRLVIELATSDRVTRMRIAADSVSKMQATCMLEWLVDRDPVPYNSLRCSEDGYRRNFGRDP